MSTPPDDSKPKDAPEEPFVAELIDEAANSTLSSSVNAAKSAADDAVPATPAVTYEPTVLVPPEPSAAANKPASLVPSPFANLAAKGGAVGAVVLGIMSLVGSFITSYAILNSVLGMLMGLWGLSSNHRKMAAIGIAICLLSAFFCMVEISNWIESIWTTEEL